MKLGALDFGLISSHTHPGKAMRETIRLASIAERLGFSRYWLAEHHEEFFAWAAPEVLVPLIGEATSRIRIGPAGFLLHFYSPLKIAEVARALHVLFAGRFDLGLAAGLSQEPTRQALVPGFDLAQSQATHLYAHKVVETLDYLRNRFPAGHRYERGATPAGQGCPEGWLMATGKGKGSMNLAAREGLSLSYSLFHGDGSEGPATLTQYREVFQPSAELASPRANVAATVICAETEAQACRQFQFIRALNIVAAVNVCGTPPQCREQILELGCRFGVEEVILVPLWESFDDRARTFELLAEAFHLRE